MNDVDYYHAINMVNYHTSVPSLNHLSLYYLWCICGLLQNQSYLPGGDPLHRSHPPAHHRADPRRDSNRRSVMWSLFVVGQDGHFSLQ